MSILGKIAVSGFSLAFVTAMSSGQTVVPIANQAKELRRAAHQLRISSDHLRNARDALRQATDLARHSSDMNVITQLAQHWVRIDKSKAPGALEDLYGWLSANASDAATTAIYQRCMSSAQALLRSLATLDTDRAIALWRQWPDPPSSLGEDFRRAQTQTGAIFLNQLSGEAPALGPPAADLTSLRQQAARGNYSATAQLAAQLLQANEKGEALRAVDDAIADFKQRQGDVRTLSSYFSFVRQLPGLDSDRYLQALSALFPALETQAGPNTGGTIKIGNQSVQVTASEAAVIDLCRSLTGRPELSMRTLNIIPGLKSKLDRIGGIDSISPMSGGLLRGARETVSLEYSIDGINRTTYNSTGNSSSGGTGPIAPAGTPLAGSASGMDLYQTLRGKLAKNPELVQQRLAEVSKTPDQIDGLVRLANMSAGMDADLASLALEKASQLLMQVEPLQRRASVLLSMISAYQRCDGEVDPDLLQKGLLIVQQLREEEKNNPNPVPTARGGILGRSGSAADQLEMAIIAELAVEDFGGALRFVRMMPDEMKIQMLLRIVQSLLQSF
jgi:hypothetical protein